MRRTQIYIDPPLDDLLAARAALEHRSKASLIREAVAQYYGRADESDAADDPMDAWIGGTPAGSPGNIDDLVYGTNGDDQT